MSVLNIFEDIFEIEICVEMNKKNLIPEIFANIPTNFVDLKIRNLIIMRKIVRFLQLSALKNNSSIKFRLRREIFGFRKISNIGSFILLGCVHSFKFIRFIIKENFLIFGILLKQNSKITKKILVFMLQLVRDTRLSNNIKNKFDFYIYPSTGVELENFVVLNILKNRPGKSIFILDNWDNLTSKIIFPVKPDVVTVMGKSSIEKAMKIHGFSYSQIEVTSLPRFSLIPTYKNSLVKKPTQILRVCYLGFSLPHSEEKSLVEIHRILSILLGEKFHLTYRAHPQRQIGTDHETLKKLSKNFDYWNINLKDKKNRPIIDKKYLSELTNYDLVISTPTTMALESIMLGMPCLIVASDSPDLYTSSGNACKYFIHAQDLLNYYQTNVFHNFSQLEELLKSFVAGEKQKINKNFNELVDYSHDFRVLFNLLIAKRS
jgi:hypothetical protein